VSPDAIRTPFPAFGHLIHRSEVLPGAKRDADRNARGLNQGSGAVSLRLVETTDGQNRRLEGCRGPPRAAFGAHTPRRRNPGTRSRVRAPDGTQARAGARDPAARPGVRRPQRVIWRGPRFGSGSGSRACARGDWRWDRGFRSAWGSRNPQECRSVHPNLSKIRGRVSVC
jgi:hypothetical protein